MISPPLDDEVTDAPRNKSIAPEDELLDELLDDELLDDGLTLQQSDGGFSPVSFNTANLPFRSIDDKSVWLLVLYVSLSATATVM